MALLPSLGRGQISVKPTGHARFSVENYQTYFEILSYFLKKSIGQKRRFILFIYFLVVKPYLTNSQRFLN